MKIRNCMLALAISSVAATAMAKDSVSDTMRNSLIHEQGYTELSEGFFVKRTELQESYFAVGSVGNQTMAQKLLDTRNASEQAVVRRGGDAAEIVAKYDDLIGRFNVPAPNISGERTGSCTGKAGTDALYVNAQTSGGNFALANAVNYGGNVNSTNYTNVWLTNRGGNVIAQQTSTTYGATPSHSQVSIPDSAMTCEGNALASISCPGYSNSSVSIFLHDLKWFDCRN